jgi:hypothetical protein
MPAGAIRYVTLPIPHDVYVATGNLAKEYGLSVHATYIGLIRDGLAARGITTRKETGKQMSELDLLREVGYAKRPAE